MKTTATALALTLSLATGIAGAGPLDRDCTPEKAAKTGTQVHRRRRYRLLPQGGRSRHRQERKAGVDGDKKDKGDKGVLGKDKDGK